MAKENLTIHSLMKPSPDKVKDRAVWGLPLHGLWVPFFTATNVTGESHIDAGALGCPLRLAVDKKSGAPKMTEKDDGSLSPRYTVARPIRDAVQGVKDNFAFGLMAFVTATQKAMPNEYKAQVEANQKAGEAILQKDDQDLADYLTLVAASKQGNAPETTPTETKVEELVAA